MKLLLTLVVVGLACAAFAAPSLDSAVLKTIETDSVSDLLISFKNANVEFVRHQTKSRAAGLSRGAKAQMFYNALKAHADNSQANVMALLQKQRAANSDMVIRSLWITNQISVKRANFATVSSLLDSDEISEIAQPEILQLVTPVYTRVLPENYVHAGEQWGVAQIDAPSVWSEGVEGEGIVIGSIDSGAYGEHEALASAHRVENGWYDPAEGHATPHDGNGHGTHTIGTILGRENGIGVARKAKWISCKGLTSTGSGSFADLIECGQFMVCPTANDGVSRARCDLAPHAVSNSWGGSGGSTIYNQVLQTWIDVEIAPIFAAGNNGHVTCRTLGSPGDSRFSITVGSTDNTNTISVFSSVGPNLLAAQMPDVAAPGTGIISAYIGSPNAYATSSGTSMATPHVSGLAALLYSQRPSLTVDQLRALLRAGAVPTTSINKTCGNIPDTRYPNNHVGQGRISARGSVDALRALP